MTVSHERRRPRSIPVQACGKRHLRSGPLEDLKISSNKGPLVSHFYKWHLSSKDEQNLIEIHPFDLGRGESLRHLGCSRTGLIEQAQTPFTFFVKGMPIFKLAAPFVGQAELKVPIQPNPFLCVLFWTSAFKAILTKVYFLIAV